MAFGPVVRQHIMETTHDGMKPFVSWLGMEDRKRKGLGYQFEGQVPNIWVSHTTILSPFYRGVN
jgi:hypothetical protein